jgi:predicted kinase
VPRLILINGPPACGKSTMARMYAAGHPLALVLDIDRVRGCLGRWREDLPAAGRAARAIALAAAREHLHAGHHVVVPQLLARPGFLADLEHVARDTGAGFAEIVLLAGKDHMLRAFADRAASARPADIAAHELAGHPGSDAELTAMHDRLTALLATRPAAMIVPVTPGQPGITYAAMLAALDGRPGPAPADHSL